jgi:hypothetical protein
MPAGALSRGRCVTHETRKVLGNPLQKGGAELNMISTFFLLSDVEDGDPEDLNHEPPADLQRHDLPFIRQVGAKDCPQPPFVIIVVTVSTRCRPRTKRLSVGMIVFGHAISIWSDLGPVPFVSPNQFTARS